MKIKVMTNFIIPEKAVEEGELEIERGETLGGALLKLSRGPDLETMLVFGEKGSMVGIDDMWEIRVNGRACYEFPGDLDTPLNAGDVVTVWLTPLGGG